MQCTAIPKPSIQSQSRIPELEVGEFYQQLSADPPSQPGKLAAVEDGIGVRLCLRLIDQVRQKEGVLVVIFGSS